jgi:hypothetical protein
MGTSIDQELKNKTEKRRDVSARRHGRAINATADFLRSHLRVPHIFLEPTSALWEGVDIVAADGAGSGDIHAVEVKVLDSPVRVAMLKDLVRKAKEIPAHYKYLAVNQSSVSLTLWDTSIAFSSDGIGRIGLLLITEHDGGAPTVQLAIKPERFRLPAGDATRVERFLDRAKPDMFVRI